MKLPGTSAGCLWHALPTLSRGASTLGIRKVVTKFVLVEHLCCMAQIWDPLDGVRGMEALRASCTLFGFWLCKTMFLPQVCFGPSVITTVTWVDPFAGVDGPTMLLFGLLSIGHCALLGSPGILQRMLSHSCWGPWCHVFGDVYVLVRHACLFTYRAREGGKPEGMGSTRSPSWA